MNERLTLQDLIDLLAKKREITKKEAETFLRELFALIAESIEGNDAVKIKDFGTFKLIKVNARKSVDVNTGASIEIAAHYKLNFTPEKTLREAINRPFAHFESVILEDNVTFENMKEEFENSSINNESDNSAENVENVNPAEAEEVQPVDSFEEEEEAEEERLENKIESVFSEIEEQMASMVEDEPITIETLDEEEVISEDIFIDIDNLEVGEPMVRINDTDDLLITELDVVEAPSIVFDEEDELSSNDETLENENIETAPTPARNEDEDEDEDEWKQDKTFMDGVKEKSGLVAFIIIMLLLAIGVLGYKFLYIDNNNNNLTNTPPIIDNNIALIDSIVAADSIASDSINKIVADSIPTDTVALLAATPKNEETIPAKKEDKKEDVKPTPKPKETKPAVKDTKPTAKPKETKPAAKPKTITIQEGHTLRMLGLEYYGNKSFWVYIYQENKAKIKNPNSVALGTTLTLPTREKYGIDPKSSASIKKAKALEGKIFREFDAK